MMNTTLTRTPAASQKVSVLWVWEREREGEREGERARRKGRIFPSSFFRSLLPGYFFLLLQDSCCSVFFVLCPFFAPFFLFGVGSGGEGGGEGGPSGAIDRLL